MTDNVQIAETIIKQLGGYGRLRAMVKGRQFVAVENGVQFTFSGSRKFNKCRIILDWSDTYTFELWKINSRKGTAKKVYSGDGLYWDMLIPEFERQTGLYLRI